MKVSVVIPCYNSSKTIETCIESVFNQSFLPYEIIVIDDGSSDNTLKILEKLKTGNIHNIIFNILSQENCGPSVARNNGVEHAQGDWIAFLDSDDYWLENNLNIANEFIKKNPRFSLLGGGSKSREGEYITFKKLLFKNYFKTSSTIIKKECILKYPFNENQKFSEDYRTWLSVSTSYLAYIVYGIDAFPVVFRENSYFGGGLSSKLWKMQVGELSNYWFLLRDGKISTLQLIVVCTYSCTKYINRLISKFFKYDIK